MTGVALLRAQLQDHSPGDAAEARSRARTLSLLNWLAAPFDQHSDPTHVTGSAIVTDGAGRVVLHRHKRLGLWLQPGGHVDPGELPWEGAVRETAEETGLRATHQGDRPRLVHVDVHEGPRGHVHLDVRYLLLADPAAPLHPGHDESPDVAWFTRDEAVRIGDASLAAAVRASLPS